MTKITVHKALLEQAIEALPDVLGTSHFSLRTKLRAALAEPAPAPMSPANRLVAYSAATRLRELGFEWDATAEAWLQPAPSAPPPPAEHSCKWPTCQTEKYQQDLSDQLARELIGTPPAEVATLPIKNAPTREGVFKYLDSEVRKEMAGFYEALNRPQPLAPAEVPMLTEYERLEFVKHATLTGTLMDLIVRVEAKVRQKAGL